MNDLCKNFLWNSNTPKISLKSVITPEKDGGIGYTDVNIMIKALAAKSLQNVNFLAPEKSTTIFSLF